ncbi:hypothetical protein BDP27DRAFT_1431884 [Rhodocollybia butyracea]|uniref:Uncharacterized protein n=1 Tax=Rhodocollybia butyracea TaxID=206335 RepID=A0A9P5P570_9AGAR|nr:hypothetical protein BDP27DRAFT_1431884 [Rhodocollybia butyracea]
MSSNTDNTTVAAPVSNNADTEEANLHHVATLVKASKEGTALDASYDAILKSVMENAKSRDALMKAIIDNTKLQGVDLHYGLEEFLILYICVDPNPWSPTFPTRWRSPGMSNDFHAQSAKEPTAIETQLDPPSGTKGFSHQFYKVTGTNWTLDVFHLSTGDYLHVVDDSGNGIPVSLSGDIRFSTR